MTQRGLTLFGLVFWVVGLLAASGASVVLAQSPAEEGWTFTVGSTAASGRSIDDLCGLVVPEDWQSGAPAMARGVRLGLPAAYDWRTIAGCPPVRDQGACGSCWAFATVGALECNILIQDGDVVDLSEQWLVSCNTSGYDCGGGWFAHEYHQWKTDSCGGTGAVLEADFPYVASAAACGCPYAHPYTIEGWAYVNPSQAIPAVADIKQAIMEYGPVAVAVRVDAAFAGYTSGIFNASSAGAVNHAVLLVGWDDNQGTNGVWFLRNSWGPGWGEDGYMRIAYGCSSVGYAACFVTYAGQDGPQMDVSPAALDFGSVAAGDSDELALTVTNTGTDTLAGSASGLAAPFSIVGASDYSLAPGQDTTITVRFSPVLQGSFANAVTLTGGGGATVSVSGLGAGDGPSDTCADAPAIADGTFGGSNVAAGTDGVASCGGGGTQDVWWRYEVQVPGTLTIDTCGSDFDTVLSVYDACGGTELACNDDDAGCGGGTSRVSMVSAADATYYIRVAGRDGATGAIVLNVATDELTPIISGRVVTTGDVGLAGVTLIGLPGDPATDEDGYYTATVYYGFAGQVTPQKTAYSFTPASRNYAFTTSDVTNQDYAAVPPNFVISGEVLDEYDRPVAGVILVGLPGSPTTDEGGRYHATVSQGFSGTVTPTRSGCSFMPATRRYDDVSTDLPSEDYEADVWSGALRVTLAPSAALTAGARWRVGGGAWLNSGQLVSGLPVGQYTLSYAAVTGWTSPMTESVVIERDGTVTLEREYSQQRYLLTVTGTSASTGQILASPDPDGSGRYVQGTLVTLTADLVPGFHVSSWSGVDEVVADDTATVTMSRDRTVTVAISVDPFCIYQLTASVSGAGGSLTPSRGVYRQSEVVTLVATPDEGYEVRAWSGTDDDDSTETVNTVTMNHHKIVRVAFQHWSEVEVLDEFDEFDGSDDDPDDVPMVPVTGMCGFGLVQTMLLSTVGLWLLRVRAVGSGRRA
jgi:hypothetical protein